MSRYIDADKIPYVISENGCLDDFAYRYDINEVPTADVVEVVRCRECAYYREENSYCLNPHCSSSFYGHRVKENHYCNYGEKCEVFEKTSKNLESEN